VQCLRTITLGIILLELLPFIHFLSFNFVRSITPISIQATDLFVLTVCWHGHISCLFFLQTFLSFADEQNITFVNLMFNDTDCV